MIKNASFHGQFMSLVTEMVSKVTVTLFFASIAFLQTNGCITKELIQDFLDLDLDKNGFVTHDEVCNVIQTGDEDCGNLFEYMDLNADGQATCQGNKYGDF